MHKVNQKISSYNKKKRWILYGSVYFILFDKFLLLVFIFGIILFFLILLVIDRVDDKIIINRLRRKINH